MKRTLALILVGLLTSCSNAPLPGMAAPDPSDSTAPIVDAPYQPVLAGTAAHRPVSPKSWREMNERVAPAGGRR